MSLASYRAAPPRDVYGDCLAAEKSVIGTASVLPFYKRMGRESRAVYALFARFELSSADYSTLRRFAAVNAP